MCQKHTISRFVYGNHPHTHSLPAQWHSLRCLCSTRFLGLSFSHSLCVQCLILNGVASCARFGYRAAIEQRQQQCINNSSTQHTTLLKRSRTDVGIYTEPLRIEQEFDVVTVLSLYMCVWHGIRSISVVLHCRALILSLFVFFARSPFEWYLFSLRSKFIWSIFHVRNSKGEFDKFIVNVCLLSFIRSKFCYALSLSACMYVSFALLRIFTKILSLCFLTFFFSPIFVLAYSFARSFRRWFSLPLDLAVAVIVVVCSLYTHSLQFFVFFFILFSSFFNMFLSCRVHTVCIHIHKINGLKTFILSVSFALPSICLVYIDV